MTADSLETDITKLYILLCGYEILPKSVSVSGADPRFMLCEPVCAYLLETCHGWVLLDTGLDPEHMENTAKREQYFLSYGMTPPIVRPMHRLEHQLAQIGLTPRDISWIILSHLHFDHCGSIKHFPHARISVQRQEYLSALTSSCSGYIREDFTQETILWDFRDGDWQAFPGLDLITTFGHTAGHQSALIRLPHTGPMILSFDAGDLRENFLEERIPGSTTSADKALHSIRRIKALQYELNAQLVLFHDPQDIQTLKLLPQYYD